MKSLPRWLALGAITLAGILYYVNFLAKHAETIGKVGGRF